MFTKILIHKVHEKNKNPNLCFHDIKHEIMINYYRYKYNFNKN